MGLVLGVVPETVIFGVLTTKELVSSISLEGLYNLLTVIAAYNRGDSIRAVCSIHQVIGTVVTTIISDSGGGLGSKTVTGHSFLRVYIQTNVSLPEETPSSTEKEGELTGPETITFPDDDRHHHSEVPHPTCVSSGSEALLTVSVGGEDGPETTPVSPEAVDIELTVTAYKVTEVLAPQENQLEEVKLPVRLCRTLNEDPKLDFSFNSETTTGADPGAVSGTGGFSVTPTRDYGPETCGQRS